MFVIGNYTINLKFGDTVVPVTPSMIQEITVTQDLDRLLPTFKLVVKDATGLLGEIVPFDKGQNIITLGVSRGSNADDLNEFKFLVDRRSTASNKDYAIQGVLDVPGLLDPEWTRALTGNVKTNLETICEDEFNISDTEIGLSLNYNKTLVQPGWNNAKFLVYLRKNLVGRNSEAGYYCFIKNVRGEPIFVFRSIDEIFTSPVKYNLIVGHKEYKDYFPVNEFKIFDDSQIITSLAAKIQNYSYFNYSTGQYVSRSIGIDEYPSLSQQHLVDDDNVIEGSWFTGLGRSNDFTTNFDGRMRNSYYKGVTGFINMWASTWGLENASPGDIVKVVFSEALSGGGDLFLYQHSGYWMVKRVVHIFTSSFMTNFLLVRSGIDTDIENSLVEAQNQKRRKA